MCLLAFLLDSLSVFICIYLISVNFSFCLPHVLFFVMNVTPRKTSKVDMLIYNILQKDLRCQLSLDTVNHILKLYKETGSISP